MHRISTSFYPVNEGDLHRLALLQCIKEAFLGHREPLPVAVEKGGEILALLAETLASVAARNPELSHRLQRLTIQMIGSELVRASQILSHP